MGRSSTRRGASGSRRSSATSRPSPPTKGSGRSSSTSTRRGARRTTSSDRARRPRARTSPTSSSRASRSASRREPPGVHPRLAVREARRPADAARHGDAPRQARGTAQDLQAARGARDPRRLRARLLRHAASPQLLHPLGPHRGRTGPHPVRLRRLLPARPLRPPRVGGRGEAGPQPGPDGRRNHRQLLPGARAAFRSSSSTS